VRTRFARAARKHRIGYGRARSAMAATKPFIQRGASREGYDVLTWISPDDRGVELEIVGIQHPDYVLVIHVMPAAYRRNRS
jgi:hypothetical protein